MIRIENIKKSFGSTIAVDGLSFEVKRGEIIGFLGPNGAGKTTTMRLITGFLSPDSGEIYIDDIPVSEQTGYTQRHIGYLPENNPLYKDMLVSELLNFSAELKHIPKEKKRSAFDFAVSSFAIGDVFYRPIKELSKGYKQRVGMAAALLHQPPILIMDEPTEGLDPNQRTDIRSLIKKFAEDRTIIMSTHVMQEASAVCNRMLIINRGRLVANGTPEELSRAARHEHIISIDIEGNEVEPVLRNLPDIENIDIEKSDRNRVKAKLTARESIRLQPEISRLANQHQWTIWHLVEEEHKLEDIFHKLTHST